MSKKHESADEGRRATAATPPPQAEPASAPPGDPASAANTVSDLMAERRRYEEWLAGLDARRTATPDRVFTRVHADYTTRLEAVVRQLTSHTEGLRAELGHLTTRLGQLTEEQQQARDERAEAELRAHVGELTATEWEQTARAADERIDGLVSRRADAETELARTRQLLTDAERPATPHLSAAAVPASPRDAVVEATVTASVNAAAAAATPGSSEVVADSAEAALHVPGGKPAGKGRASSFDELAFLNSVVDTAGGESDGRAAAPAAEPRAPAPVAAAALVPAAPAAQAISLPAPGSAGRRDSMAARSIDEAIINSDATADTSILGRTGKKGTPMAANISGNNPIVLKDKPVENARTLKCADCSAMNFPTEWYCERCGAELASL